MVEQTGSGVEGEAAVSLSPGATTFLLLQNPTKKPISKAGEKKAKMKVSTLLQRGSEIGRERHLKKTILPPRGGRPYL